MGYYKDLLIEIDERGYGLSDFLVCSRCIGDKFLKKYIRNNGIKGKCSCCNKENIIIAPLSELMRFIVRYIRFYYDKAIDVLPWDSEENEYVGNTIDTYDLVYEDLADILSDSNQVLLDEIFRILNEDLFTNSLNIENKLTELLKNDWDDYCRIVRKYTYSSAEIIVSLLERENLPADYSWIKDVLSSVVDCISTIKGYKKINRNTSIFRANNFLKDKSGRDGFYPIPSFFLGTAPHLFAKNGRFNEAGDSMFYGAANRDLALREVDGSCKSVVAEFRTTKEFKIIDLSSIDKWKYPSRLDIDRKKDYETFCFMQSFIEFISEDFNDYKKANYPHVSDDDENEINRIKKEFYFPFQVFMKYIQKHNNIDGIKYKSSKALNNNFDDVCYVLFVENSDCIEKTDIINNKRKQLILINYI